MPYYHKAVKHLVHRPYTTQKNQSYLEYKSRNFLIKDKVRDTTQTGTNRQSTWLFRQWKSRVSIKSLLQIRKTLVLSIPGADFTEAVPGNMTKNLLKTHIPCQCDILLIKRIKVIFKKEIFLHNNLMSISISRQGSQEGFWICWGKTWKNQRPRWTITFFSTSCDFLTGQKKDTYLQILGKSIKIVILSILI